MRDTALLLRTLWRAGFRTGVFEDPCTDAALETARALKVPHVLHVDDQHMVHVRSATVGAAARKQRPVYREHSLTNRQDVVEYVQRLLAEQAGDASGGVVERMGGLVIGGATGAGGVCASCGLSTASERSGGCGSGGGGLERSNDRASSSGAIGSGGSGSGGGGSNKAPAATSDRGTGATYQVTFVAMLRQTSLIRKRLEATIVQNMNDTLMLFGRREMVHVLAVELSAAQLRSFAGAIDRRATEAENEEELGLAMER